MNAFDYAALDLPIVEILPKVLAQLAHKNVLVLEAAPGAGKSSLVPLALLGQNWLGAQKILLLEPRRIAARATAERMASLLGESVGETVGYQMRMERRISAKTRIVVVTEGVLTRMLQDDPALEGVGAVIFDEFHERSVQADLGLALCLQAQQTLRGDLRLLVMSATLDGVGLAERLDASVVQSVGRMFPVALHYLPPARGVGLEAHLAVVVKRALAEVRGDVLVFLPGKREIQRAAEALAAHSLPAVTVLPLHGELDIKAQHAVLSRDASRRRVILATNIAETSLTIEGVQAVVDSGLVRVAQFDPATGMTRLVTQKISRANAEQRRGRAGRLSAGVCYRLWGESEHTALMPQTEPEIRRADMLPLALELAAWGASADELFWLDAPPTALLVQAQQTLQALGALDSHARITAHGRALATMPLHPRLAHVLLRGAALGQARLACELAALLSERELLRGQTVRVHSDLALRLEVLRHGKAALSALYHSGLEVDEAARAQARRVVEDLLRRVPSNSSTSAPDEQESIGALVALAYPERLAKAVGEGRFVLASGRASQLDRLDVLAQESWLAVAHVGLNEAQGGNARVFLAAKISQAAIERHFGEQIISHASVEWDARVEAVSARTQRRLGNLLLEDKPLSTVSEEVRQVAFLQGIRVHGLACLPWQDRHHQWRGRVMLLRRVRGEDWPDMADEALLAGLEGWLAPFVQGMSRLAHLERLDLDAALRAMLDWPKQSELERLVPTHLFVPSGSQIALDYAPIMEGAAQPVLAVKLQELFGQADTPCVLDGRVAVMIHLLSPAQKPLAVTQDLASFWRGAYQDVRKDMRGRYPKHPWPEDPQNAVPTRLTKKALGRVTGNVGGS
ncbi:MAG: ATP-dependent helicase HrpB [Gammaproteobacteria bacterium 28-57-27]|nr:MAG: ATP-dependent helicase HrpB [Gammaproteobacteria bacterium 28-57-27]